MLMIEIGVGLIARTASLQAARSLPPYAGGASQLAKCVNSTGPLTSSIWKVQ